MKDIDFDELDRAVSSLMNDVPKSAPVRNDDVKTVTLSTDDQVAVGPAPDEPTISATVDPVDASEDAISSSVVSEQPKPASSPAMPAARRGRFMDMVRSPARETRQPLVPSSISRQGPTLQPISSGRPVVVGNPIRPEPMKQNDFTPTPDNFTEPNEYSTEPVSLEMEGMDSSATSSDAPFAQPISEQPPMASPFLPDAKVEKRPLGRTADSVEQMTPFENTTSSDEISMAPAGIVSDNLSPNPDAQLPEQPLPAELDSKLLDIETSTASLPGESPAPSSAPEKSPSQPGSSRSGSPKSLASTSIPQQYKVQPKVADETASGTIYDTASYHQPLAHPPKKKPGWLWVVAIIVILLLGAAGGAVAYYLGLV